MPTKIELKVQGKALTSLKPGPIKKAAVRVLRKAGKTALRDMRSEASKRVRQRKRIKAKIVRRNLKLRYPKGRRIEGLEWALLVGNEPIPLAAYPHRRTRRGVSVAVNKGKRSLVRSAFLAAVGVGHRGVFIRKGRARLPIKEQYGSTVFQALSHTGQADAVLKRGQDSLARTFDRLLALELEKL